ncbi:MAG: hypothetical protein U1E60_12610 [Reyranellaceae bacterium]
MAGRIEQEQMRRALELAAGDCGIDDESSLGRHRVSFDAGRTERRESDLACGLVEVDAQQPSLVVVAEDGNGIVIGCHGDGLCRSACRDRQDAEQG